MKSYFFKAPIQREVSIEQQVAECEAYARARHLRVVKVYADRAMTGTNDKRPQFQQMLKDAEKRRWSVVICYKVDRFARNRYDSATYKLRLKKCGVSLAYAMEPIPDGPMGILMESVLEGSAEYYSANLSENVRRGLRFNAEACLSNGRIPYGYKKGADGHFVIDEAEGAIVREVFSRVSFGEVWQHIVNDFKRRGVPTSRGGQWRMATLRVICLNEAYRGVYHFGDVRVEGGVLRLVDDETWEEVQKRMDSVKGTRVRSEGYLFGGKVYCGFCGAPMVGTVGTGHRGEKYYYYACKAHRSDPKSCPKHSTRRDLLEGNVIAVVVEAMNDQSLVDWIADTAMEAQRREAEEREAAPSAVKSELAEVKRSLKGIMDAIEHGIYSSTTQERLLELEARKAALEEELSDLAVRIPIIKRDAFVYWLTRFRQQSENSEEAMREFASVVVWQIRVWEDHADAILNYGGVEEPLLVPLDTNLAGSPDGYKGWA